MQLRRKRKIGVVVLVGLVLAACNGGSAPAAQQSRLSEVRRFDTAGNTLSISKVSWPAAGELRMQTTLPGVDGQFNTSDDVSWQERSCSFDPAATGLPMVESLGGYGSLSGIVGNGYGWPLAIDGLFCQRALGSTLVRVDAYNSGGAHPVSQTITVTRPQTDRLVQTHAVIVTGGTTTYNYAYTDTVDYVRDGAGNLTGRVVSGAPGAASSTDLGSMPAYDYADAFSHNSDGRLSYVSRRSSKGVDGSWFTADDVKGDGTSYTYLGTLLLTIAYGLNQASTTPTALYTWQYVYDDKGLREQLKVDANNKVLERWLYESY